MALVTDMDVRNSRESRLSDYFALKNGRELVENCFDRIEKYHRHLEATGKLSTWKRSYKNYYLGGISNARLKTGGEKNEFVLAQVNHFSNIVSHILNNVTNQRSNLRAKASNSDFKSLAQTKIGNQVLEHYLDRKGLEDYMTNTAELALIFDHGYLQTLWDPTIGKELRPDETGQIIREGDIEFDFFSPLDVITDYTLGSSENIPWRITRKWVSRWELAAKYPEYQDQILSSTVSAGNMRRLRIGHPQFESEQDQIPLYTLFHEKGHVLPDGRMVQFIDADDVILIDSPLPHKRVLHRIAPKEQLGTIWGYTVAYDLLPIQENLNMLYSIIASNQAMFGVQSLLVPKGSNIEYSAMMGGLKIVEYNAIPGVETKPSALQLTSTPAEIFNHITHLIQQMETISGVNSVVRGQPEASLESGAALALVASQAIQFLSSFQQSWTSFKESVGTGIIEILKDYANEPRLLSLAGKHNAQYMKEFSGQDIANIERVTVEDSNPIARTTAGKLQIAQDLIKNNLVTDPKQYLSVIETGSLEPLTQGTESQLMLIEDENERLSQGENVPVIYTDIHYLHLQEHATVLANLEARLNPNVVKACMAHMQEHVNQLMTLNPIIAGATNQPVLNQGNQTQPPQPGAQSATGPTPDIMNGTKPPPNVKPPNMPTNPLTKQQFNPVTGGI